MQMNNVIPKTGKQRIFPAYPHCTAVFQFLLDFPSMTFKIQAHNLT